MDATDEAACLNVPILILCSYIVYRKISDYDDLSCSSAFNAVNVTYSPTYCKPIINAYTSQTVDVESVSNVSCLPNKHLIPLQQVHHHVNL